MWANESDDEFLAASARKTPPSQGQPRFLPPDHPMSRRMQAWVDRLDTIVRTAHPEALASTPKPLLWVRKLAEANAWVTYLPVAWDVPARQQSARDGASSTPGSDLLLEKSGTLSSSRGNALTRAHSDDDVASFLAFHNASFASCRLSYEDAQIVFGKGCTPRWDAKGRAPRVAFNATARHITLTTGNILALEDEDRIVTTLAHELGHYYRSHANMPSDVLNFFYRLETTNTQKTVPEAEFAAQTERVRKALREEGDQDFSAENALMVEKKLGFYTDEQEADEWALELLANVGISGNVMVDKLLAMQKERDRFPFSDIGNYKWAECTALREHGFKNAQGVFAAVPVGDLSDPHHSLCFRAANVAREIQAHAYAQSERTFMQGDAWPILLKALREELAERPKPTP
jgi:hypothetical protein